MSSVNRIPAVYRLPAEIFIAILSLLEDQFRTKALNVCRTWREIYLGYPRFWTSITFFLAHIPQEDLESWFKFRINLSRSLPLDIIWSIPLEMFNSVDSSEDIWDLINRYAPITRWKSLKVRTEGAKFGQAFRNIQIDDPLILESLDEAWTSHYSDLPNILAGANVKIRHLMVHYQYSSCLEAYSPLLREVTTLECGSIPDEILPLLSNLSKLVVRGSVCIVNANLTCQLSRLRDLRVIIWYIPKQPTPLVFPFLENLSLENFHNGCDNGTTVILPRLRRLTSELGTIWPFDSLRPLVMFRAGSLQTLCFGTPLCRNAFKKHISRSIAYYEEGVQDLLADKSFELSPTTLTIHIPLKPDKLGRLLVRMSQVTHLSFDLYEELMQDIDDYIGCFASCNGGEGIKEEDEECCPLLEVLTIVLLINDKDTDYCTDVARRIFSIRTGPRCLLNCISFEWESGDNVTFLREKMIV